MADTPNITAGPRIINGILKWYEGDTFALLYTVDLYVDEAEEPYEYQAGDKIVISFYENKSDRMVYSFIFDSIPTTHQVALEFTTNISKLFKAGFYTYAIKYMTSSGNTEIITVGAKYKVEVERCHQ